MVTTPNPHDLETLVANCVAALDRDDASAVENVLQEHPSLATHVRSRLHKLERLGILSNPVPGVPPDQPESIGPYRILDELGRGGMGHVYLAEQRGDVHRQVAVKVIRFGMDTREIVSRFKVERQTLALLNHPNIAQVFDAGTDENGRPYFVMEYVPGSPVTRYCDEQELGTRERLELFLRICDGVQHAHQKGVIHRDIKPSNLLIADDNAGPVAKIIDFGIAKATRTNLHETLFTQPGQIVGTLEYMSPEQASSSGLNVDTRTDVYSLGVVLYELLCGRLPIDFRQSGPAGLQTLLRLLTEQDPPPPSTVRKCAPELDWITMRALERSADLRYGSVQLLRDDIAAFLADRPVMARAPTMRYRARKFVRRHRYAVAAATIALVGLVGGLISSTAFYVRSRTAELAERAAHGQTRRFYTTARQAIDELLSQMAQDHLADEPGAEDLRRALLARALAFYRKLVRIQADSPNLRGELAFAHMRLASLLLQLGETTDVRATADAGMAILRELCKSHPDDRQHRSKYAAAQVLHANIVRASGDLDEARGELEQATRTFRSLRATAPESPLREGEIEAWNNLGMALRDSDATRAAEALEIAISLTEQHAGDDPEMRVQHARLRGNLADLLLALGRTHEAETEQRHAVTVLQSLVRKYPRRDRYRAYEADRYSGLASTLEARGKTHEAEQLHGALIRTWRGLAARFPRIVSYRISLASALAAHARSLLNQKSEACITKYEAAVARYAELVDELPDRPTLRLELASALGNLASSLLQLRRTNEARELAERHAGKARRLLRPLRRELPGEPRVLQSLATVCTLMSLASESRGAIGEAVAMQRTACQHSAELSRQSASRASGRQSHAMSLMNLGRLELAHGDSRAACASLEAALTQSRAALDFYPAHPAYRGTEKAILRLLGRSYAELPPEELAARDKEALVSLARDLTRHVGDKPEALFAAARGLAVAATKESDAAMAKSHRRSAIRVLKRSISRGYRPRDSLSASASFAALRGEAGFRQLAQRVER